MNPHTSISTRITIPVVIATSVLFFLAISAISIYSYLSVKEVAIYGANLGLEKQVAEIESVFSSVESAVNNTEWVVQDNLENPDYMFDITSRLVSDNTLIVGSAVAFRPYYYKEKGRYYAPYSCLSGDKLDSFQMGSEEYDYFNMDWYRKAFAQKSGYWSEPYYDEGGGEQLMTTYSLPVLSDKGDVIAILTADMSLQDITRRVNSTKFFDNSISILLGRTGTYISTPNDEKLMTSSTIFDMAKELKNEKLKEIGDKMITGNSGWDIVRFPEVGHCFLIYRPLGNGWTAATICTFDDVFASMRRMIKWMWFIAIVSVVILYFMAKTIIHRKTLLITEFTYTAMNIAKGNFNAQIHPVETKDEIGRLHDSLQYMMESLHTYIDQLKTSTASNERYENELNIASQIQDAMLVKVFPDSGPFDIYATVKPAKEIGGDLYDFHLKGRTLYFAVGDVSGKGVPAALYMAITRSAFRFISGLGLETDGIVSRINNAFCEGNSTSMFVTLFVAKVDLDTLEMTYCNAGHNPPVIIKPDGTAEFLNVLPNIAAGLFEDFEYRQQTIQLEKGTRFLLYTDGVSEAETESKDQFTEARILEFAKSSSARTSVKITEDLYAQVKDFTAGAEQNDDITIMAVGL